MPPRDFLIFLAICVAWALNTIVSKLVVGDMAVPPLFYAAARTLVVGRFCTDTCSRYPNSYGGFAS